MAGDSGGFESYLRGSWWEVQIKEERSSMFLVSYNADKDEEWAWVPLTELRLSSRRGDGWDCYLLKKGMDVSVLSKHPHSSSLNLEKEGLYDARVSSVAKAIHAPGECTCKFSVHFLSVKVNTYIDGSLSDRILLADHPETQLTVSDLRILQKPTESIPLHDILDAHLDGIWIPLGRGCQDAYFLTETELSTAKRPPGVGLDHTGPTHVRSDDVLSPSAARVSPKNGERGSNCNSPVDQQQSPGTPQAEYRAPKSASGSAENQKQNQSGGSGVDANGASPQSINVKRKNVPAEDHAEGHSNGMVEEEAPKKKGGRPMLDKSIKGVQIVEEEKICNKTNVNILPALHKDLQSMHKEKTKYIVKEEKDEDYLLPEWNEDLRQTHMGKRTKCTVKKEGKVDLEWTANLSSGDDSDSDGEWKPIGGLKSFPTKPYNIRTRDRTVPHKPISEERPLITGRGRRFLPFTHVPRKCTRTVYGKNTPDKEDKRDYRTHATGSREVLSSKSD